MEDIEVVRMPEKGEGDGYIYLLHCRGPVPRIGEEIHLVTLEKLACYVVKRIVHTFPTEEVKQHFPLHWKKNVPIRVVVEELSAGDDEVRNGSANYDRGLSRGG